MIRALWTAVLLAVLASPAFADVVAHDAATVEGRPVFLVAETRGILLAHGGELVEFIVDAIAEISEKSGVRRFSFEESEGARFVDSWKRVAEEIGGK